MASAVQNPIADLRIRLAGSQMQRTQCPLYANDQVELGRRYFEEALGFRALSISTHHLSIRCVNYDDDSEIRRVAPMVYVRALSKNPMLLSRYYDGSSNTISNTDPDVLLDHRDILHLTPTLSVQFMAAKDFAAVADGLDLTQRREIRYLADHYHITDRKLGAGAEASVFVAIKKRTRQQVACKIVPTSFLPHDLEESTRTDSRNVSKDQFQAKIPNHTWYLLKAREDLKRECNILKTLNHPNIVALEKVFYTRNTVYIFQELLTGGDLLSYMEQKGLMSEPQSAVITYQILKAVDYLHVNGVVHRDLKPENILMTSWRDGSRLVLTDFGQSAMIRESKAASKSPAVARMQTLVGTPGYAAPEVLRLKWRDPHDLGYSKAIDIWSVGCITAGLLTGDQLFGNMPNTDKETTAAVLEAIRLLPVQLAAIDTGPRWRTVGRKAKAFIRACVDENASQRLSASEALRHVWLNHPRYTAELEAVYERAIQDWTPRVADGNIMEFMDTARKEEELATHRSLHFANTPAAPFTQSSFFCNRTHAAFARPSPREGQQSETAELSSDTVQSEIITQASTIVPYFTQQIC